MARRWNVPEEKIRTWVSRYRLHGIDGLHPKRSADSSEFKLEVLSHQDRERLSSRRVAAIYNIRNPNQVVVWRRDIAEGDAQALGNTMPKPDTKPERRCSETPPEAIPDSADALREENERLRAEVAVRLCIGSPANLIELEAACERLERILMTSPRISQDAG
ncbi:transposase [Variovorax sp. GrIS 2.14]|uniref:helix-turn-helix domain-containing protein n=1 Tax=Variovorax sp. GrIS 2.14 TaxID=3071709 RepID=UPI0038F77D2B